MLTVTLPKTEEGRWVMGYASLLVHVESDSPSSDARLELAASLARRFEAVLIGIAAGAVQLPMADPYGSMAVSPDLLQAEEEEVQAELRTAEEYFKSKIGASGLELEWRAFVDMPARALVRQARAADLVIIGRDLERLRRGIYGSADPGEVLMGAGRPLLVVPPGADALSADHVVVAWKDTREARRALRDALPFLRLAESVHVVEVAPEEDLEIAGGRVGEVVWHLERHRVKAGGEARRLRESSAADELILVAEQHGADLIVAGGYGHARLREWVFGGVTRDLLNRCPKCVLLSH